MLVAARLSHVAATKWDTKGYLHMNQLVEIVATAWPLCSVIREAPAAKLLQPNDLITAMVTSFNNYIDSNSKFVTIIKIIPWQIEKSSNRMIPAGTSTRKRPGRNIVTRQRGFGFFRCSCDEATFSYSMRWRWNRARFATAGGENIANIQQFTATANASGQFVVTATSVTNNALISGIEID
jgi:hypothetical protein